MPDPSVRLSVLGLLSIQQRLALLDLPIPLRRRLLNRALLRVRGIARRNVAGQRNPDGNAFQPRRRRSKRKMLRGLVKPRYLIVTRLTAEEAALGWKNSLMSYMARQHQDGATTRRTALQMRRWSNAHPDQACTERQAKRLRRLGYKVHQAGRKAQSRPSIAWIRGNISASQAGLLIRALRGEAPGPSQWDIRLPKRAFLGVSNQDAQTMLDQVLTQVLSSAR